MKQNDTGDFCVLYVEPTDDRATLMHAVIGQKRPVVILLAEQVRLFHHPEDFTALKHVKRQMEVPIVFVIPHGERLTQLAGRNGFPVYASMDALADALIVGQLSRQRGLSKSLELRTTGPLNGRADSVSAALTASQPLAAPKKTVPLDIARPEIQPKRTEPLAPPPPLQITPPQGMAPLPQKPLPVSQTAAPGRLPALVIVMVIIVLTGGGLGMLLLLTRSQPVTAQAPTVVGHIAFLSSDQLSENTNQGISDEVQVTLDHLVAPASHQSYYAWLLGDKSHMGTKPILLGTLHVNNGHASLFYADPQHTNLLAITSRFLVTQEDAAVMPIAPSPDDSTWRYYGEFSQAPMAVGNNAMEQQYSFLDHLRHLLASDPLLDTLELPGGLSNWLFTNTGKILEWTGSTREHWEETKEIGFIRRQMIRSLAYLDGLSYVQQDLPPGTNLNMNERLARIGLLEVNGANQDPPPYLTHIIFHLNGLIQAGGSTPTLRKQAAAILDALNNVRGWLQQVRQDARKIMQMSDTELQQPQTLSLLDDMIANANYAYVGQTDVASGQRHEGVIWIHDHIQALANMDITAYVVSHSPMQIVPGSQPARAV